MIRLILVVLFALVMFLPVAQAEEQIECTGCYCGTLTKLPDSKDLAVLFSWQCNGIIISHSENKFFNAVTYHCEGLSWRVGEINREVGYCRNTDPDGDIFIHSFGRTETEFGGKFLEGTGKYKGIKGTIKAERLVVGKPVMPGTWQLCNKYTITYELPK